jgi:hypothetical protein
MRLIHIEKRLERLLGTRSTRQRTPIPQRRGRGSNNKKLGKRKAKRS